ncbi:hypothetical protein D9Q98_007097 [Chlorella vulgaris]|uniref:RING-type E3 ubiquitin transferase n=1 Tax=Chlorella vulgaris TaxID=3077 RepID=A0A9D4YUU5_CHLVU|nr:hypothetical protein D9Q98_007097 [Chlorella vulgaris]
MAMALNTRRYVALSFLSAAAVVWHAFSTREQFFPSMVYLSSSKFSLAVLGNMGFAFALASYKVILRVFLGRLRDSEVERVNDKVGQAVVETCLAMTIFREDFTASFLIMFVILSFVKIFHWLVQDRVDFVETTPNVSRLQHLRIATFALVLLAVDLAFLHYSLSKTLQHGVSVHLLFAFEYTVQASTIVLTFIKYCLSMADMAMEGRWEGKGVAVFYLELTLDMLHLLVYCAFFAVVFSTYGIPLHLVRDLYWTFRNFQTRVRDFLRYRRITANMDQSFPDATEEDLQRGDHTCIICREEMSTAGRNKKLGCSHVFHLHCLRSWLERQQNCPICRRSVVPPPATPAAPAAAAPAAAAADNPIAAALEQMRAEDLAALGIMPGQPIPAGRAQQQQQQAAALRRRRGVRGQEDEGQGGGAGGGGVPGAAAAQGGWHVADAYAQAYPQPHPQWVPAAPMAVFVPAGGMPQLQYAGQQHAEHVLRAQQAAAAATAAVSAGMMQYMVPVPVSMPYLLGPPHFIGPPASALGQGVPPPPHGDAAALDPAAQEVLAAATPQQHVAAAAATAAAAASMLAPLGGGTAAAAAPSDPTAAAATAAAAAALERVLQQQLQALRAFQEQQAQQAQQPAASTIGSGPSDGAPAAPDPATATATPAAHAEQRAAGDTPAAASSSSAAVRDEPAVEVPARQQPQRREDDDGEAGDLRRRRLERFGGA